MHAEYSRTRTYVSQPRALPAAVHVDPGEGHVHDVVLVLPVDDRVEYVPSRDRECIVVGRSPPGLIAGTHMHVLYTHMHCSTAS